MSNAFITSILFRTKRYEIVMRALMMDYVLEWFHYNYEFPYGIPYLRKTDRPLWTAYGHHNCNR
jgi:hypothetical protein